MTLPVPRPGDESVAASRQSNNAFPFFLPTEDRRNAFGYLLARFARIHRVEPTCLVMLDNLVHLFVNDPEGNLSAFLRDLYSRYAEFHHARYGTSGKVVAGGPPGKRTVVDLLAETTDMLRCVTLPVELCWVDSVADWDGVVFSPENIDEVLSFSRPPELAKYRSYRATEKIRVAAPMLDDRPHRTIRRSFRKARIRGERTLLTARPPGKVARGPEFVLARPLSSPAELHEPHPGNGARHLVLASTELGVEAAAQRICEFRVEHRECFDEWTVAKTYVDDWPPGTDYHYNIHGFARRPT